jgi:Na+-transporting NADH:ubiquinone oxidoreductase subunit NqrF
MPKIRFENEQVTIDVPSGTTIRQAALDNGIIVNRSSVSCGGRGLPGCNCKVWVRARQGAINDPTFWEKLPFRAISGTLRLACQVRVQSDVSVATQP